MPFQPGNTEGSKSRRDKPFRNALIMEAKLADEDQWGSFVPPKGSLRSIARNLLYRGMSETAAAKEVADRLDGKVPQAHEGTEDGPPIGVIVTGVRRKGDDDPQQD